MLSDKATNGHKQAFNKWGIAGAIGGGWESSPDQWGRGSVWCFA